MNDNVVSHAVDDDVHPVIKNITVADLKDILKSGLDDFAAHPSHRVFLSLIFPIAGFFMIRFAMDYAIWPLIIPLAGGFALVGSFAAIGMYGLSRRHENYPAVTWRGSMDAFRSASLPHILTLGLIQTFIYILWIYSADIIYQATFASVAPSEPAAFVNALFTTAEGWSLLLVGNAVGIFFAAIVFSISVVSFPLLIDHDVSLGTAVTTSIRAVKANPRVMAIWAVFIAVTLLLGSLPFFVGLAIVLPILGHASWHLYRKVVEI